MLNKILIVIIFVLLGVLFMNTSVRNGNSAGKELVSITIQPASKLISISSHPGELKEIKMEKPKSDRDFAAGFKVVSEFEAKGFKIVSSHYTGTSVEGLSSTNYPEWAILMEKE